MTRPDDMAAHCVDALLSRNDLDPALVEDCIVGAGSNEGAQGYNMAATSPCCRAWASPVPA